VGLETGRAVIQLAYFPGCGSAGGANEIQRNVGHSSNLDMLAVEILLSIGHLQAHFRADNNPHRSGENSSRLQRLVEQGLQVESASLVLSGGQDKQILT
jgi:hypothetical protein